MTDKPCYCFGPPVDDCPTHGHPVEGNTTDELWYLVSMDGDSGKWEEMKMEDPGDFVVNLDNEMSNASLRVDANGRINFCCECCGKDSAMNLDELEAHVRRMNELLALLKGREECIVKLYYL